MIWLAVNEPCGAAGFSWTKTGAEGAVLVPWNLANQLLALPGENFFPVQKPEEKEVKEVITEVVEQTAEVTEVSEVKTTPKRRSTKE